MALVVKDRVKETTTTTGTGAISLGGAVNRFVTFSSVLSDGDTTYYAIENLGTANEFEVGIGTYASSGNTLTRTTVLASSNSNNAVNFSSGNKEIFITYPADKAVYEDASGNISIPGTIDGRDLATDGTKLDGIEANATADQTAAEILTAIKTVDGASSGLDADLLDGQEGSYYTNAANLTGTLPAIDGSNLTGSVTADSATINGDVEVISTDTSSTAGPVLCMYRNSASPADGDYLGQVKFQGESDTGVTRLYAKITGKTSDVTNGTEDGLIETAVKKDGSNVIVSRQTGTALKLINNTGLEVAGQIDADGGIDVTGNITVSGTVDGKDVSTLVTAAEAADEATALAIALG
jgi:hypothetical protein